MIQLHDKVFKPFIAAAEIEKAIARMATEVYAKHKNDTPLFLAVLNGAFMFASDFVKHYPGNCEISFVKLSSYEGTKSTSLVKELIGLNKNIEGRKVIVLEDIVDTGNTLVVLKALLDSHKVESSEIATLFYKPESYHNKIPLDYIGIEIPNKFIVGFGLDYDELGRNLPEVYQLNTENTINTKTMINLVLFGKPGAGKGTQAAFLKDKYQLVHISTGDVFRYNIKNETALGTLAKTFIDKGELVPDEVTIDMLSAEVEKNPDAKGFIFDGFPRTIAQADALDTLLTSKEMKVSATIALEADDEVLIQRLLERGKVSGRSDDQDESKIRNRFEEYNEKTAPLIDFYKKQDKFYSVNGIGSIEDITQRLSAVIDTL